MEKSTQSPKQAFLRASWSYNGCCKGKKINPDLNLLISSNDYCSPVGNTIKTNAILVRFPQNKHWSDSMWRVCNISSVIILKCINRDLCIVGQRTLFLQDRSSVFLRRLCHSPTTGPMESHFFWLTLHLCCKMGTFLPPQNCFRITQVMLAKIVMHLKNKQLWFLPTFPKNMTNTSHTDLRITGTKHK